MLSQDEAPKVFGSSRVWRRARRWESRTGPGHGTNRSRHNRDGRAGLAGIRVAGARRERGEPDRSARQPGEAATVRFGCAALGLVGSARASGTAAVRDGANMVRTATTVSKENRPGCHDAVSSNASVAHWRPTADENPWRVRQGKRGPLLDALFQGRCRARNFDRPVGPLDGEVMDSGRWYADYTRYRVDRPPWCRQYEVTYIRTCIHT